MKARPGPNVPTTSNNLVDINNYSTSNGGFPPARTIYNTTTGTVGGTTANNGHGWAVDILPYIERTDLYTQYKFHPTAQYGSWSLSVNQPVVNTPVSTLQCPSAPPNRIASFTSSTSGFSTSDRGCSGDGGVRRLFHSLEGRQHLWRGQHQWGPRSVWQLQEDHLDLRWTVQHHPPQRTGGPAGLLDPGRKAGIHGCRQHRDPGHSRHANADLVGRVGVLQCLHVPGVRRLWPAVRHRLPINCNNSQGVYSFHTEEQCSRCATAASASSAPTSRSSPWPSCSAAMAARSCLPTIDLPCPVASTLLPTCEACP